MTAREYLDKHPAVAALIADCVREAKDKQMTADQAIALVQRRFHSTFGRKIGVDLATEFFIA